MLYLILFSLILAAIVFFVITWIMREVWINPARTSLKDFEISNHLKGESYEVLFTPFEPEIFVHDPIRENYTLIINDDGFGLKVSFPASLYSHYPPLFFPWKIVTNLERSFLTNVLIRVKGREEGFYLYAGIKAARRLVDAWDKSKTKQSA
ncbi:MAG: hypothetical protein GYA55_15165 [SAR324 cluster bacterium]|uniref:Uncharacterized protein n=1 Tax=SAR324 cluster bacterium TaxID=2024889 RepID=A0A7X9FUF4_9DELT|nr:hypothetical protein [SAR324 cluster bacterium]